MDDELRDLLEPIPLSWRVSELLRWVEDYRSDYNSDIMAFHSPAKGSIDVYESPFSLVGMYCDKPVNGAIELTPYVQEGVTAAAVAELRRWRTALEASGGMLPRKSKRGPRPRTQEDKIAAIRAWDALDRDRFAITLEQWLEERYGLTGGKLNVPPSTFHGWRKLLRNS